MPSTHTPQVPTARLNLNVYLQRYRRHETVRWVEHSRGSRQRPHWTVTCYLSGIKYGTGYGLSKSEAKERAAAATLDIINRQHIALWSIEYFRWATENHLPQPTTQPSVITPERRSPSQTNARALPPVTLPERKRSS